MDTKVIPNLCPKCQAPLPADAPQGLCPKCLLAAVATPTDAGQPAGRPAPPPLAQIAAAFPQLEVLEFIGQGGMGFIFKARQPKLDRLVALKILPQSLAADPTFAERFNREAKLLARLNHPGIVTVHDFGVAVAAGILPAVEPGILPSGKSVEGAGHLAGSKTLTDSIPNPGGKMPPSTSGQRPDATTFYYLLMEFVDGVNLRQAMQAGRFTPDQALAIVPKICEALQFAHNEGILHRDIKPENILLDAKGRVKLADFGIAKLVAAVCDRRSFDDEAFRRSQTAATENLTEVGKTLGTPNYMAPEQLANAGEVDHRADIYSLGVVFYEMLTGELPLGRFAPPSQKSAADPRVDEVVLRALEKEKARRHASADEVRTQVETIAETLDSSRRRGDESQTEKQSANKDKSQSLLTSSPTNGEARFSRLAIVGVCWLAFVPLHFLIPFLIPSRNWFFEIIAFTQALLFWTAPVGVTILGWVAVAQIRRAAGNLYGLGLAVFDGLVFPLLAVNLLIGWLVYVVLVAVASLITRNGQGTPSTILVILCSLPIGIPLTRYLIRHVWRAVNAGSAGVLPAKTGFPRWAAMVLAAVVLAVVGVSAFFHSERTGNADPASLVNQPQKLKSLPTATVIQVGMADIKSAWAWQELKTRAKAGRLDPHEARTILDNLTAWMRREHPQGYNQPLHWIGGLLDAVQPWITPLGETNALAFLEAYYGNPSFWPVPRLRENETNLWITCEWRSSWLNRHSLGFELLNEMRSISVDGRQVPVNYHSNSNSSGKWNDSYYCGRLQLPKLAPGKHVVRCEVDSAFVADHDMPGLAKDASSKDWPPAQRRWTRVCEAEFMVYATDAELVRLTEDPALNPVANGALACQQIIIRSENGRLTATVPFDVHSKVGLPIGVDVALRIAGQTFQCGKLFAVETVKNPIGTLGASGAKDLTVEIGSLDAQIKEADIVLTPNPKAVEEYPYVDRIWGKEIVISHVPLSRQDLYGTKPVKATTVPTSNLSFGPVVERVVADIAKDPSQACLDFKTGEFFNPAKLADRLRLASIETDGLWLEMKSPGDDLFDWVKVGGVDLIGCGGLMGGEWFKFFGEPPNYRMGDKVTFDTVQPSEVVQLMNSPSKYPGDNPTLPTIHVQTMKLDEKPASDARLILFRTHDGDAGVMEILGASQNPRGVKIRYKLVQQGPRQKAMTAAWPEPGAGTSDASLKLQDKERALKEAESTYDAGQITLNELQKAKYDRDIAAAELRDDAIESARLKLAVAELNLDVAEKKWSVGRSTRQEFEHAKMERDSAMIRYQMLRNAVLATTNNPVLKPIPADAIALYAELCDRVKSGFDGDPQLHKEETRAKLNNDIDKFNAMLVGTIAQPLRDENQRLLATLKWAGENHDDAEAQRLMKEISSMTEQFQKLMEQTNSPSSP